MSLCVADFYRNIPNNPLFTVNISQLGELLKEYPSRAGALVFEEGPSANNPLQLPILSADFTNAVEVHSGIDIDPIVLFGLRRSALTEITASMIFLPTH